MTMQTEAEFPGSEEQFSSMFRLHHAVMLLVDPTSGAIVDANHAASEFYGYTPEHLRSMNISEINQLSSEEITRERISALELKRNCFVFPHRLANGEIRTVEVHSTPMEIKGAKRLFSIVHDITERTQAESALRESDKKHRRIVETAIEGILMIDADQVITYANPQMAALLGRQIEDLVGRPVREFIHGDDLAQFDREMDVRFRGNSSRYEQRFVHKNGNTVSFQISASPIAGAEGRIVGSFAMFTDISDRKLSERAVREHEERLQFVQKQVPAIIWSADRHLIITSYSGGGLAALNVRREDRIGKPIASKEMALASDEAAQILETCQSALLGRPGSYVASAGGRVWESHVEPLRDDGGEVNGIVGISIDITERRKAEEGLRRTNERLNETQEAAGAGSWDWDIASGHLEWSPVLFRLFGLDKHNVKASFETWRSVLHPADLACAEESTSAALADHAELENIYRVVWPDGQVRWISALGKGHYDSQGQPVRMRGICLDITERKQREHELLQKTGELATIFEHVPVMLFLIDSDRVIQSMNTQARNFVEDRLDSASEMLPGDALGCIRTLDDPRGCGFGPSCSTCPLRVALHDTLQNGTNHSHILFQPGVVGGKPSEGLHLVAATTAMELSGKKMALLCCEDVTERKRAERAAMDFQHRFHLAFQRSPLIKSITRVSDSRYVDVNRRFEVASGWVRDEVIGRTPIELGMFVDTDEFKALRRRLETDESAHNFECRFRLKTGEDRIGLISAERIEIDGELCTLSVVEDITENRRSEESSRRNNLLLESKNAALKEILDHIQVEKDLVKTQITANRDKVIAPLIRTLKKRAGKENSALVTSIEKALEDITSPFANEISRKFADMSPREIEVCAMIKSDMLSKEIADHLGVSIQTIHKFRQRIRQKLGIANEDVDLGTFLRSL